MTRKYPHLPSNCRYSIHEPNEVRDFSHLCKTSTTEEEADGSQKELGGGVRERMGGRFGGVGVVRTTVD